MGKRFVVIWFPYLQTDLLARKDPLLHQQPFVLRQPDHGKMVIKALNLPAIRAGLFKGQSIADARAIVEDLIVKDPEAATADLALEKMARWCIRFSPLVGLDLPDGLILESSGCAHLWGGEERYCLTLKEKLESFGISIRLAMAGTIGIAWALAHFGTLQLQVTSGKSPSDFLELPVAALRIDPYIQDQLQTLGLVQIRQILSMPRASLARRFSPALLQRINQAMGDHEEWITPIALPEPYAIRLPCLEPIITRTGVDIALEHCLVDLTAILQKEQLGIREAVFTAFAADGKQYSVGISTNRPSLNQLHLQKLFALRMDQIRYSAGIDIFLMKATRTEKYMPAQEKIWEGAAGLLDPQFAEWIDQMEMRYGKDVVSRYLPSEHHLPEKSFRESRHITEEAGTDWHAPQRRPMQLLDPPQKIEVTAPIPDYPPMMFRHQHKLHKIIRADGPERIEQEWWVGTGKHRDYYIVEDEEGKRYWLFRSGHYDEARTYTWYLHGYFI